MSYRRLLSNAEQLDEFAAAPDLPDLSPDDFERVAALEKTNFGVWEEPATFKGEPMSVLEEMEAQRKIACEA